MSQSSRQIGWALRYKNGVCPEFFVGADRAEGSSPWVYALGPNAIFISVPHLLARIVSTAVAFGSAAPWIFLLGSEDYELGRAWVHEAPGKTGYGVKFGLRNWVTPTGVARDKDQHGATSEDAASAYRFPTPKEAWDFAFAQISKDLQGDVGVYPLQGPATTTFEFRPA